MAENVHPPRGSSPLPQWHEPVPVGFPHLVPLGIQKLQQSRHRGTSALERQGLELHQQHRAVSRQYLRSAAENALLQTLDIDLDEVDPSERLLAHEVVEG